ncbi:hypothetical protein OG218_12400 [Kineococcus sp. NBC_00420]|uniref:hypothetical protein n=1 Tax=Kineococcus sp. NBC_00420 TaxID=2903564 RepID=UPI002E1C4F8A
MSRHPGPTPSPSGDHAVRRVERAFAEWLTTHEPSQHVGVGDLALRLQVLRTSRRDLARRRGDRHPDRVLTTLVPDDVELLVAQSRRAAEWWGLESVAEVRATCRSWLDYLRFLVESGRWEGDRGTAAAVRDALLRRLRTERGELLASGGHTVRTSFPVELAQLQRTRLVREAEDVLRGRTPGTPRLRAQLEDLGFGQEDGRRGPRWPSWDSPQEADAACARRRLVVAEVVRVVRTLHHGDDDDHARTLALATSESPADVAEGGRRLEAAVSAGALAGLVRAGVVPVARPWRIARGLQHSVHVALSRLVDEGVLDGELRRPVLAVAG